MTYDELLSLPDKTLHAHGLRLESERNRLDQWVRLADREEGKWLAEELTATLNAIRAYYAAIPINTDYTAAMLAGNQGREAEVVMLIRKLKDSQNLKKDIDTEIEMVLNVVNERRKVGTEPGSFVPASHKPKEDFNA